MTEKVLDFNSKRIENIEEKRRNFERVLFQNFLGCYTVIQQEGVIYPVELVDISSDGCLFQVPWDVKSGKKFDPGTEVTLRFYFTNSTYIPVIVESKYGKEYVDNTGETYMRYGCEFDTSYPTFEALKPFIEFMYKFAEHSATDKGDTKIYNLR